LVVEDEATLRTAIAYRLQWEGYEVIEAVDAVEATAAAREHEPDLVILDFFMPGGDGGDVFRRLQRILQSMPPVIFMSGVAIDQVLAETLRRGDVRLLMKPFDVNTLVECVRRSLEGSRAVA
jgi:DNA-binding response OmpR family regulator